MFESYLWKKTPAYSCMFATRASFFDHSNIVLYAHAFFKLLRLTGYYLR
jgi:hypothetical protein